METSQTVPNFAADFVNLCFRYCYKLRTTGVDTNLRFGPKSLVQYFFHTHSAGERCHLEGIEEHDKEGEEGSGSDSDEEDEVQVE
jgi:hypothetical protein